MLSSIYKLGKSLSMAWAATVLAIGQLAPSAHAASTASIVLGDIEYTNEGAVEDEARRAIETYLRFFLSRLLDNKPQQEADHIRACRASLRFKNADDLCPLPDFFIQLQIAEREREVQISGAVSQKIGPRNWRPHNLNSIRVKMRDLTDGLSRVAKNIGAIYDSIIAASVASASATAAADRAHVVIACFGSGDEPRTASPGVATSALSDYADRLSKSLEWLMRDQPLISVSISKDAGVDCSSLEGFQAIATAARAEAVMSARIFSDDRSGLFVSPQIFIDGANKRISLPLIHVPSGDDAAASFGLVARKLAAATDALVGSKRSDLVKAIGEGAEFSYYLDRAKEHLSLSPPEYDTAETLLELAVAKAPAEQESYLLLASLFADRGHYSEAREKLRNGIAQVAQHKALFIALAEIEVRAEDLPEARRVYQEALSKNVLDGEEAWLRTARTYFATRPLSPPNRFLAMVYAVMAQTKNPRFTDAYFLAGQIAEAGNDFKEAETYYQQALKLSSEPLEIVPRLSSLYERWTNAELSSGDHNLESAIEHLTNWIEISQAVRNYYDRAEAYLAFYSKSGQRTKGYQLASADYRSARNLALARGETVLTQFPWLMPNLVETLILEGKFREAKEVAQELFVALGTDASMRPPTDPKDIRLIATFLNFAAEMLDSGSAEKELYLLENSALGTNFGRLSWSFSEMEIFLDEEYSKMKPELDANERASRTAAVKQLISRIRGMKG